MLPSDDFLPGNSIDMSALAFPPSSAPRVADSPDSRVLLDNFIHMSTMQYPLTSLLLLSSAPRMADSPDSGVLLNNFIHMSTKPFDDVSGLFIPSSAPRLADSPDSGVSSPKESLASLFNYTSPAKAPVRKEKKKRIKEDFCKLCMKNICVENQRSQGPSRHVHRFHMKMPRFFCPHCDFSSNYDKGHVTNHMKCMHKGLGGEIRVTTDPIYAEKFKKMRNLCFGASKVEDEFNSSTTASPPRLAFSIETILAPITAKTEASPPLFLSHIRLI